MHEYILIMLVYWKEIFIYVHIYICYIECIEEYKIMGRTSRHERKSKTSSRKRGRSSSTSSSDINIQRIKQLEALVAQMRKDTLATSQTSQYTLPLRTTYPGDELMIPIFDPMTNTMTAEEWVKRVDDLALQYKWDDRSIFRLIISRLDGHAKIWFDMEQKNMITWAATKIALVSKFRKAMPFAKLLRQAVNYETSPGQELGDYCLNKLHKIRKCALEIPEVSLIDLVIDGVKSNLIAGNIRAAGKITTNDLYNHMLTLGKMPIPFKQLRENKDGGNSVRSRGTIGKNKRSDKSRALVQPKKADNMRCYNCGILGHISRTCRKPLIKCSKCKCMGHWENMCRKPTEMNTVEGKQETSTNVFEVRIICDV